jgi:hypothetical protein
MISNEHSIRDLQPFFKTVWKNRLHSEFIRFSAELTTTILPSTDCDNLPKSTSAKKTLSDVLDKHISIVENFSIDGIKHFLQCSTLCAEDMWHDAKKHPGGNGIDSIAFIAATIGPEGLKWCERSGVCIDGRSAAGKTIFHHFSMPINLNLQTLTGLAIHHFKNNPFPRQSKGAIITFLKTALPQLSGFKLNTADTISSPSELWLNILLSTHKKQLSGEWTSRSTSTSKTKRIKTTNIYRHSFSMVLWNLQLRVISTTQKSAPYIYDILQRWQDENKFTDVEQKKLDNINLESPLIQNVLACSLARYERLKLMSSFSASKPTKTKKSI